MLRRLFSLRMWYSTRSPGSTGLRNFALSIVMKKTCFGACAGSALSMHADRAGRLRHALDQQDAGKDRPRREMARELRLVEGDVLDADAGLVAVDLDDPVDEQKRIAVRQQLEDSAGCRRPASVVGVSVMSRTPKQSVGSARRSIVAGRFAVFGGNAIAMQAFFRVVISRNHSRIGLAGVPPQRAPGGTSLVDVARRRRSARPSRSGHARRRRPARRGRRNPRASSSPEMPTWATMTQWRPMTTLWPI